MLSVVGYKIKTICISSYSGNAQSSHFLMLQMYEIVFIVKHLPDTQRQTQITVLLGSYQK